jgi:hypothetical protein
MQTLATLQLTETNLQSSNINQFVNFLLELFYLKAQICTVFNTDHILYVHSDTHTS